jgi:hypothetical protein
MNNSFIQADIFFFITSISVILIVIVALFILYYIFKSAKAISRIINRIESESEKVVDDIENLRVRIKEEGQKVSGIGKWLATFLFGQAIYKKARKKKD